jgi:hypothetical protein
MVKVGTIKNVRSYCCSKVSYRKPINKLGFWIVRKIGIFWYILILKLHIQFVNNFMTMMSETRLLHVFKVNMNLMINPIKKRSIRLSEVGPMPVALDALLLAGEDMLEWPA